MSGGFAPDLEDAFRCPSCDIENRPNAKFCRRCGAARSVLASLDVPHAVEQGLGSSVCTATDDTAPGAFQNQPFASLSSASTFVSAPSPSSLSSSARSPLHLAQLTAALRSASLSIHEEKPLTMPADLATNFATTLEGYAKPPECLGCFTSVRNTDKFCSWCGEPQPERALPQGKYCADCSKRLPDNCNFCFACGRNSGGNSRLQMRIPLELWEEETNEFFPSFEA